MFLNTIRYLSDHKHLYYICGDFNINLGNLEVESNIKDYVNSLISLSCKLLISKPTRVSDHSATIIDHMYTNDNKHDILSGIPIYEISDHLPIFAIAKQIKPNARNIYKNNQFRDMKCFCPENFLFDLQQTLNQTIVLDPDVPPDSDLEILAQTFLVVLNKHAPLCNVSRKHSKVFKNPWMTRALLKSIITKNKLYSKVWNKKGTFEYDAYKQYRNALNRTIKAAKQNYYEQQILLHKNDPKKLWKTIHSILEINPKSKSSIERIVDETGNKLNNPQDIANSFNQYFCNIGPELAKTITPPTSASSNFSHSCTSRFALVDTSVEEVVCGIEYLKNGKALKVDDIPTKFLKMAKTVLA